MKTQLKRLSDRNAVDGRQEMTNIIHALCCHLDSSVSSPTHMENKLTPLKTILAAGLHRKCFTKFVVDRLVQKLEKEETLSPKCLNNLAEFIRIILYSKPVGGKKDYCPPDAQHLEDNSIELKSKMTFAIINAIQNNPGVGVETVSIEGRSKRIEKPRWMDRGFTQSKHITNFYLKSSRRKKVVGEAGNKDAMCEAIVRKVHAFHGKALSKIRDRLRADAMKEFMFLFEDGIEHLMFCHDRRAGPIDLKDIPLVNLSRVPPKQKKKVARKAWDGAMEIVSTRLCARARYNVEVELNNGEVEKRELVREVNLLSCAALVLMRLSGNGTFADLLTYHEKIIHVIVGIGELLVCLLRAEWSGRVEQKQEDCDDHDEHYHLLHVIHTLRPTQVETRTDFMRDIVMKMPESYYNMLNYCPADTEGPENAEPQNDHDVIVDDGTDEDDDDDDLFDEEELKSAVDFLATV